METIPKITVGWIQSCNCEASEPQPSLVLDPFTGSGTVAVVALQNNCNFIGTELNPEYIKIAEKRILDSNPMFNEVEII
jgi:DNA modification methylase